MNIFVYEAISPYEVEMMGVVDNYESFNFTKSFQGCGSWTLKLKPGRKAFDLLKVGRFIYLREGVSGFIDSIDYDSSTDSLTAYGKEMKGILGSRIVWGTYDSNAPTLEWLYSLVETQCGTLCSNEDRTLVQCVSSNFMTETETINKQVSYKNILDIHQELMDGVKMKGTKRLCGWSVDVDFYMRGALPLFVYKFSLGADRTLSTGFNPIIFSRSMDNFTNVTFTETQKNKANVVLAAGEGEGAQRKLETAGDTSLSGFSRKEAFVDCRDLQSEYSDANGNKQTMTEAAYRKKLKQEAQDELIPDNQVSIAGESVVTNDQALDLLGATVTVKDDLLGVEAEDCITEINIINDKDGTQTTLTIGSDYQFTQKTSRD